METNILIFLFFVSVTVIFNTFLIFGAYWVFAGTSNRATKTMAEFYKSSETRELIDTLQVASERAAFITEATKQKMLEFDPKLTRAQEGYRRTLESIDARLEKAAATIDETSMKVRDVVAKPAFSVASFAAGMSRVINPVSEDE